MEVNGGMTCKPKLPLLFSSHDDLRYSVSPGSCHPLWHRSHRRKSHIWHRRSHGLCDRPWHTLCTHLPHPPSYRYDSGTWRMKRNRTRLCIYQVIKDTMPFSHCFFIGLTGPIARRVNGILSYYHQNVICLEIEQIQPQLSSQRTINFSLPVLVHELLLSNSKRAELVAKGVFILPMKNIRMNCSI